MPNWLYCTIMACGPDQGNAANNWIWSQWTFAVFLLCVGLIVLFMDWDHRKQ